MPNQTDLLQSLENEVDAQNGIKYDEPLLNEPVSTEFVRDCLIYFDLLTMNFC